MKGKLYNSKLLIGNCSCTYDWKVCEKKIICKRKLYEIMRIVNIENVSKREASTVRIHGILPNFPNFKLFLKLFSTIFIPCSSCTGFNDAYISPAAGFSAFPIKETVQGVAKIHNNGIKTRTDIQY